MNRCADSSNWEPMSNKTARPSVTDQGGKNYEKKKLEFFRELFYRKKFLINGLASMKDQSWKPSLTL